MNVIAYLKNTTTIGQRLQSALEQILPNGALIIRQTPAGLAATLSTSHKHPDIIILLAASHRDLSRMLEMKTLLRDRKIILVLPDDSEESFARGCMIFPRFICDISSDFTDVTSVLEKMLSTCNVN